MTAPDVAAGGAGAPERRLRIFVPSAADLLTDHVGWGEGLIAWHLLAELARRGHELVVLARAADLRAEPPFELVVTGRASRFESVEPLAYMRLARRICERRGGARAFDLAHWVLPSGPYMLFAPPRGLPFVAGPTFTPWPAPDRRPRGPGDAVRPLLAPLFRRARRRTIAAASAVLGTTPDALAGVPAERGVVLPLGVDASRFAPAPLPERPRVLFLGRVVESKGVLTLVEAFARLRERVPEAELHLVGSGPAVEPVRRRAAELGLDGSCVLRGPVGHDAVAAELRDASLLCLPSAGEPFGMAVVEAMASGRAVVATDAGGPRTLVDPTHGGRLVPVGDAAALAAALGDLLLDPAGLAAMGAFNRARVERELTVARSVDRVERAYALALGTA